MQYYLSRSGRLPPTGIIICEAKAEVNAREPWNRWGDSRCDGGPRQRIYRHIIEAPTISLSCGQNSDGLPLSMQFVGEHLSRSSCCASGAYI